MDNKIINISTEYGLPGNATLETYIHSNTPEMSNLVQNLPCIIVCPGGSYQYVAEREGEPVAMHYFRHAYQACVLTYSVEPENRHYPVALTQLACAVDYVRRHHEELRVDPNKIYVAGFSAGGHLVGNLGNLHKNLPNDLIDTGKLDASPNAVVMGYPVTSPSNHSNTFKNLLGEDFANSPRLKEITLDATVNANNPPCFIWTTAEDSGVSPTATTRYATALIENKIPCECHVFPTGGHGGATCDRATNLSCDALSPAACWLDMSVRFLNNLK